MSEYGFLSDGDPTNYLTHYKRGTVYLALGKAKFALHDLDKVLELNAGFIPARLQRGNILLKQANFDEAEANFMDVVCVIVIFGSLASSTRMQRSMVFFFVILLQLSVEPNNRDAVNALEKLYPAREDMKFIDSLVYSGDHATAVHEITRLIEVCPWSSHLRERRAESYLEIGDYMSAISDIRSTTKLLSDNTEGFFKLSTWLYRLGQVDEALK